MFHAGSPGTPSSPRELPMACALINGYHNLRGRAPHARVARSVGNLCGGAGATWQERSRLPGWACQCQQGAAHGNVRAAATLSAAFARPRVAAFASPRPCAARRCQKTLIALVPAGRSSLRPRCVELARVRPGASMRACPGDIFGTFMARGACVPLFQRPSNASAERPGKCEFFVFNRAPGLAGMGGVV